MSETPDEIAARQRRNRPYTGSDSYSAGFLRFCHGERFCDECGESYNVEEIGENDGRCGREACQVDA